MKAFLSRLAGGPDTLTLGELPNPRPEAGEVVISVRACGVNFPDTLIIEDRYQFKPERPFSPGGEVAGIVAETGSGVSALKPGDRVIGWSVWGGMAEKVRLDARRCIPIPSSMPFDGAAAFLMTYGTSHYALKVRAKLAAGETLLVLGAGGGVGLAAVELGKAMGARVIAAASAEAKVAAARQRGADEVIVYSRGPFDKVGQKALADRFKSACPKTGADVIYDAVGGEYAEAALRAIAWDGRFLVVGFPAGIPSVPLNLALLKSCQIVGVFWAAWIDRDQTGFEESATELLSLYTQGKVSPFVSKRFPLEKGGDRRSRNAKRNRKDSRNYPSNMSGRTAMHGSSRRSGVQSPPEMTGFMGNSAPSVIASISLPLV